MATWHDLASLRKVYSSAPADDGTLNDLLEVAQEDVITFAPDIASYGDTYQLTDPLKIPTRWRVAQAMRVQEIWDGQNTNGAGADPELIGMPGYQSRVPTMGVKIRNMLRPMPGVPVVG